LKSWLNRAELSFADAKPGTDIRLRRAKKFDVDFSGFAERLAHGLERESGGIAIATEMAKHDPIDFSGKQFFDNGGGRVIRKMPVPRLDPLFHRPGPVRVALQEI